MPTNTAAWLNQKHGRFQVGESPYPAPAGDQIVIRNRAVAMNPLEWIIQVEGNLTYGWLDYPTVLGSDTAGEVVGVGPAVTRFQVGDRVLGHAVGTDKDTKSGAAGHLPGIHSSFSNDWPHPCPRRSLSRRRPPFRSRCQQHPARSSKPPGSGCNSRQRTPHPDRADGPGLGRIDERRIPGHPAGYCGGLRGHHYRLTAQLRLPHQTSVRHWSSTTTAPLSSRTSSPPCPAGRSPARCRSARPAPPPASASPAPPQATASSRSARRQSRSKHWPTAASAPAPGSPPS